MISKFKKILISLLATDEAPSHVLTINEEGLVKKYPYPIDAVVAKYDAWPIGGMKVRGYATNYDILSTIYNAAPDTVTLADAPTTLGWGRRDWVVANALGQIVVLTGDAGLVIKSPNVDEDLYFPIREFLVLANATAPVDPVTEIGVTNNAVLYADFGTEAGGEANVTGSDGSIVKNVASAEWDKCIAATNVSRTDYVNMAFTSVKTTVDKTHFNFELQLKAAVQTNRYWYFRMYNGTSYLGYKTFKHGEYGFNANDLGVQYISIPLADTNFKDISYTSVRLFFNHSYSTIAGYYMDNVQFLSSLPAIIYANQVQANWDQTNQNAVDYVKGRFDQTLKEDKINKGAANGYTPLNASAKIAATYLDIVNDLLTGGVDKLLSAQQGVILKSQIDAIYILLASDNINLDTVQEIVDAIETVQTSLSTILVNDLTTGGVTKALTAEMGKTLKGLIDALTAVVSGKEDTTNKSQTIETDKASTTKYGSVKAFYDWAVAKFQLALVSGVNIRPLEGYSLLGSSNLVLPIKASKTFAIAGATTLTNTHNNGVLYLTASATITIPLGLAEDFEWNVITKAGCTLTYVLASGVSALNNTGLTLAEKLMTTGKKIGTTEVYFLIGV